MTKSILPAVAVAITLSWLSPGSTSAQEIVRHKIPGSDFPIAQSVEVPAGKTTVYVSGTVPPTVGPGRAQDQRPGLRRHQDPDRRRPDGDREERSRASALAWATSSRCRCSWSAIRPRKGAWISPASWKVTAVLRHAAAAQPAVPVGHAGGGPGQSRLAGRDRGDGGAPVTPPVTQRSPLARAATIAEVAETRSAGASFI